MAYSFCPQQKQGMADLGYLPSFWRFVFSDIPMYRCCFLFLINSFAISAVHCLAAPHDAAAIHPSNFSSLNLTAVHSSVPSSSSLAMPEKAYEGANDVGRRRQSRAVGNVVLRVGFIPGEVPFTYGTPMKVGSPPQTVMLKIDMGEDYVPLITFPCSSQLVPAGRPFFNFRKSSSYTPFSCYSRDCPTPKDVYCKYARPFSYMLKPNCSITKSSSKTLSYYEKISYSGSIVYEQLALWNPAGHRSYKFVIECVKSGTSYTSDRVPPLTGSLALGRGKFTFNSQLIVNAFSFCFLEHSPSTLTKTSNMVFGFPALAYRAQAGMKKIADISDRTRYLVQIRQLKIGKPITTSEPPFFYNITTTAVLNTGSPLSYFTPRAFEGIQAHLRAILIEKRYRIVTWIGNRDLLCIRTRFVVFPNLQLPPLSVVFGYKNDDIEITVPVQNYFFRVDRLTACCALAPTSIGPTTLGSIFLQNVSVVVYDMPKLGGIYMGNTGCRET